MRIFLFIGTILLYCNSYTFAQDFSITFKNRGLIGTVDLGDHGILIASAQEETTSLHLQRLDKDLNLIWDTKNQFRAVKSKREINLLQVQYTSQVIICRVKNTNYLFDMKTGSLLSESGDDESPFFRRIICDDDRIFGSINYTGILENPDDDPRAFYEIVNGKDELLFETLELPKIEGFKQLDYDIVDIQKGIIKSYAYTLSKKSMEIRIVLLHHNLKGELIDHKLSKLSFSNFYFSNIFLNSPRTFYGPDVNVEIDKTGNILFHGYLSGSSSDLKSKEGMWFARFDDDFEEIYRTNFVIAKVSGMNKWDSRLYTDRHVKEDISNGMFIINLNDVTISTPPLCTTSDGCVALGHTAEGELISLINRVKFSDSYNVSKRRYIRFSHLNSYYMIAGNNSWHPHISNFLSDIGPNQIYSKAMNKVAEINKIKSKTKTYNFISFSDGTGIAMEYDTEKKVIKFWNAKE